jgi:hypothetical protein
MDNQDEGKTEPKTHIVLITTNDNGYEAKNVYINTTNNKYIKYNKDGKEEETYTIDLNKCSEKEVKIDGGNRTRRNRKKKRRTKSSKRR